MCNHQDLRNWVFHLHARKTGAALGSGKKISNALNHLSDTVNDFRTRVRLFVLFCFVWLCFCCLCVFSFLL
jgi:hypothetical protein